VQGIEIAVDAMDIAAVRPFWQTVLDYVDEPGAGPEDALVDPLGQGPPVWFQQMDAPRPQRNRIHLDVSVPPDAAQARIAATLAAGGRLLSDEEAPAFWVLADPEGNEVCVCTWEGRDPPDGDGPARAG
jgi:4a-hydroxytetrahydrobiopterin dehydratase